jgi:hypothetical protein
MTINLFETRTPAAAAVIRFIIFLMYRYYYEKY